MYDALDKTIAELKDTSAGWVTRRDAALALGEFTRRALAALHEHANEKDVDVRMGVEAGLKAAGAPAAPGATSRRAGSPGASSQRATSQGAASAPRPSKPSPTTMKELAQACIRKGKRTVKQDGDGFLVRVQMKGERTQDVRIDRYKEPDTREMIRVSTACGEADAESIAWAIRSNHKFLYCAFCVEERDGRDYLTIVSNFDPELATPALVKNAVKEIAYYGDWLEHKLSGEDNF